MIALFRNLGLALVLQCYCGEKVKQTSFKTLVSKQTTTWWLKKLHSNNKLCLPIITWIKKHSSKQVASISYTLDKKVIAVDTLRIARHLDSDRLQNLSPLLLL